MHACREHDPTSPDDSGTLLSRLCDMVDLNHVFSRLNALKLRSTSAEEHGQTISNRMSFSTSENIDLMSMDIFEEYLQLPTLYLNIASFSAKSVLSISV